MESLTLEHIYFIGQTMAAIAVIISLIYVGREVRENTKATQVSAAQAFVNAYNTFTSALYHSEEMADIYLRGSIDFQSLSNLERVRFSALSGQLFRLIQAAHIQWQKGALDDDIWSGFIVTLGDTMQAPGVKEWWELRKRWYGHEFQALVNTSANSDGSESAMPFIQELA